MRPVGLLLVASALAGAADIAIAQARRSGFVDMSPATRAMQADDAANPGMLSVLEGVAQWSRPVGPAQRACADCHGEAARMAGVAVRYPAFDAATHSPITLEQRINACRIRWQQAPALAWESRELLSLGALVATQSRGLAIEAPKDPRLAPFVERGRHRFEQRIGQLNFSCRDCHDTLAGRRLGAALIPQGHPTGYPIYRLEWQSLGSLQRRLRNCMTGVRAEPHAFGSVEHVELELYLQSRAAGMALETPAVRP